VGGWERAHECLGAVEEFEEAGDPKAGGEEVGDRRCAQEVSASFPIKVAVKEDV